VGEVLVDFNPKRVIMFLDRYASRNAAQREMGTSAFSAGWMEISGMGR
jgi:hypothetical protein